MNTANIYAVVNAQSIAVMLIVGAFIGFIIVRRWAFYPWHVITFLAAIGSAFFAALTVGRYGQDAYLEDALGELVLWWLFCLAMAAGYAVHQRRNGTLDEHD